MKKEIKQELEAYISLVFDDIFIKEMQYVIRNGDLNNQRAAGPLDQNQGESHRVTHAVNEN